MPRYFPNAATIRAGSLGNLSPAEIEKFLQDPTQCDYREAMIHLRAAGLIDGTERNARPIVAGRNTLCAAPGSPGSKDSHSPHALIGDSYYSLKVDATESKTITNTPTTLAVTAIDRDLPAGFVLKVDDGSGALRGFLELTQDEVDGATSLHVVRATGSNVPVTSGDDVTNGNVFYVQAGLVSAGIENLMLVADPPGGWMDNYPVYAEGSRYYACDGIALDPFQVDIRNVLIVGFPGHGLWMGNGWGSTNTQKGRKSPWDAEGCFVDNVYVDRCLGGIYLGTTDSKFGTLVTSATRDYGVIVAGGPVSGNLIHAYGTKTAVQVTQGGILNCNFVEAADTTVGGLEIVGSYGGIHRLRLYNNNYWSLRVFGGYNTINSADILHSSTNTDPNDWRSGAAVVVGSYSDGTSLNNLSVRCNVSNVNGVLIGDNSSKVLGISSDSKQVGFRLNGHVKGSGGDSNYGVTFAGPLSGAEINLNVDGFAKGVVFNVNKNATPAPLARSRVRIWGPSSTTIWAMNNATPTPSVVAAGTFSSPDSSLLLGSPQLEFIHV